MTSGRVQVTVIGDGVAAEAKYQEAFRIGAFIAEIGATLITGGRGGVMEAASKGAKSKNGLVVGILPGCDASDANPYSDVVIPTGLGHSRNSLTVLAADIVISLGGGAGTLSELAFAWIYQKPVLALSYMGGWSSELAGKKIDEKTEKTVYKIDSFEDLKRKFEEIIF